jgi:Flp pilus assembly protein TadG
MFLRLKKEKGAAAVEFALLLPLLVVIVFGITTFGFVYKEYIALTHAARDGARLAAVGKDYDYILNQIEQDLPEEIIQSVTIYPFLPTARTVGDSVTVTVKRTPIDMKIPFLVIPPFELTSTAEMRVEYNKPEE